MFCKNCGTSIDKSAKFCPSCGAPIEADSMPNIKNKTARPAEVTEKRKPSLSLAKKLWVGVAILIVGLICIAALTSNNPDGIENTSLGQTETVSDDIIIKCAQNEVSKILTSSSTARWGAAQILNHDGFGRYLVYVPLEAQNGFGGYGKLYYLVIVSRCPGGRSLYCVAIWFKIGDTQFHKRIYTHNRK